MAGLNEKFYTLILKFINITFCLLTEPQTKLQLKILMAPQTLHILFIPCSFVHQVSIDLIYFAPLKFFWVLASSLVIALKLFLIHGTQSALIYEKSFFQMGIYYLFLHQGLDSSVVNK